MTPRRTRAPAWPLVSLIDLKDHLRVDGDHDDALIISLERAAVAHLDGWRGLLGRCIKQQTWEVDFPGAGRWRLPLPDVISVEASAGTVTLVHDTLGSLVELSEAATISMVAAMPEETLDAVRLIVRLLVGHWYEHREAVTAGALKDTPLAVNALLAPIRWTRL